MTSPAPKPLTSYSDAVRRAWCYFNALRRLGFPADDIFVEIDGPRTAVEATAFVTLRLGARRHGAADCAWRVARVTQADFLRDWVEVAERMAAGGFPNADLDAVWQQNADGVGAEVAIGLAGRRVAIPSAPTSWPMPAPSTRLKH